MPGSVLRAEELRKAFGGVVALDGLSLELARGETVALVGIRTAPARRPPHA